MRKKINFFFKIQSNDRIEESNEEVPNSPKRKKRSSFGGGKKRNSTENQGGSNNKGGKKMRKKVKKNNNTSSSKNIKKERIKLSNLFTEGFIIEGQTVIYRNKSGKISNKGLIVYREKHFSSPSGWATEINKELGGSTSTRPNGWHDVTINRERLSSIRERYITTKSSDSDSRDSSSSIEADLDILADACCTMQERNL